MSRWLAFVRSVEDFYALPAFFITSKHRGANSCDRLGQYNARVFAVQRSSFQPCLYLRRDDGTSMAHTATRRCRAACYEGHHRLRLRAGENCAPSNMPQLPPRRYRRSPQLKMIPCVSGSSRNTLRQSTKFVSVKRVRRLSRCRGLWPSPLTGGLIDGPHRSKCQTLIRFRFFPFLMNMSWHYANFAFLRV